MTTKTKLTTANKTRTQIKHKTKVAKKPTAQQELAVSKAVVSDAKHVEAKKAAVTKVFGVPQGGAPKKSIKRAVTTFQDIGTWKAAHEMSVAVQRQAELFPEQGKALAALMIEATTSVCTNIAQGFNVLDVDETECYYQAAMSQVTRLENQLLIANGVGYVDAGQYADLSRRCARTRWILTRLQHLNRSWAQNRA